MKKIILGIVIFIVLVISIWEIRSHQSKTRMNTMLLPLYYSELLKYASTAPSPNEGCTKLNFNSFTEALKHKDNIMKANPEISKPNFDQHFLLLKSPMSTGSIWFIADCKTGEFLPNTFPAENLFHLINSPVAVMNPPSPLATISTYRAGPHGLPKLVIWKNSSWEVLPNTIQQ